MSTRSDVQPWWALWDSAAGYAVDVAMQQGYGSDQIWAKLATMGLDPGRVQSGYGYDLVRKINDARAIAPPLVASVTPGMTPWGGQPVVSLQPDATTLSPKVQKALVTFVNALVREAQRGDQSAYNLLSMMQ